MTSKTFSFKYLRGLFLAMDKDTKNLLNDVIVFLKMILGYLKIAFHYIFSGLAWLCNWLANLLDEKKQLYKDGRL
jgi:hypothetical protein